MNLTRVVKIRLLALLLLSFAAIAIVAINFALVPAQLGIGRIVITANMNGAGGLYPNANVTYRGLVVGRILSVRSTSLGAQAKLSIESDTKIPQDLSASIESMSAIGEMYLDLLPRRGGGPWLREGSVIPASRVNLPAEIGKTLEKVTSLLKSVDPQDLKTVIDESFTILNGQGEALRGLVIAVNQLIHEAHGSIKPTVQLIDQLGPLLQSQIESAPAIRAWAVSLSQVTGTIAVHDGELRRVLESAGPTATELAQLFEEWRPTLPILLANLVTVEQVLAVYNPALEQILVLLPPLMAASQGAGMLNIENPGQNTFFANQLNDPPPCITGFLPVSQRRSPEDTTTLPAPKDLYCKVDPRDPRSIRGARNMPCLEFPGLRAATVKLCRQRAAQNPRQYPPSTLGSTHIAGNLSNPQALQRNSYTAGTVLQYDPRRGQYRGPDGRIYRVRGLSGGLRGAAPELQNMLLGK